MAEKKSEMTRNDNAHNIYTQNVVLLLCRCAYGQTDMSIVLDRMCSGGERRRGHRAGRLVHRRIRKMVRMCTHTRRDKHGGGDVDHKVVL